jgi:hypothetical protein
MVMDTALADTQGASSGDLRHNLLNQSLAWLAGLAGFGMLFIVLLNIGDLVLMQNGEDMVQMSLMLLLEVYGPLLVARFVTIVVGVLFLEFSVMRILWKHKPLVDIIAPVYTACLLIMICEILGRFLFYAAHIRVGI